MSQWFDIFQKQHPYQIEALVHPLLVYKKLRVLVLREDQNHPEIPGNKFWKLKYNLKQAMTERQDTLLSFGGAYSNHILALAQAGQLLGLKTIGVIRGEPHDELNPILLKAVAAGMTLDYLSRSDYRLKHTEAITEALIAKHGRCFIVPEGGSNALAVKGTSEILPRINEPFDVVCAAVGTGGTLAGLIQSLQPRQQAIGFSVLKGGGFLQEEVASWLTPKAPSEKQWQLQLDYHFGGYAKVKPELLNFITQFHSDHRIPIEPVYTGKLFFGLFDLIEKDYFSPGQTILAIHTGGVHS
ncbi:MAG: 1-aminocyclopropane-1-carboxylate deaminase/D-cysteine desulfhydrase [Methylococcales bacterium]|nr:1-aminocyclopropane-1-carboxylate deaminase/D-cysteine desulfhydrase [Methylococcales bacterium]MBT7443531.1 1-aminocyclopropane-1-carboxylate deaminase/D-cysteine desulfhydrase [Methylococcales bacterium]